ncbi:MAG: hypothetical protein GX786_10775 [Clostridiales bacterium]|nr:hypothetical protein [Clostridiales bacterium]
MKSNFLKSIFRTAPSEKVVHGITIKKLPTRKYLDYMKNKPDIMVSFLDEVFEESVSLQEIIRKISFGSMQDLKRLIVRALTAAPEMVARILSDLLELEDSDYITDNLTPKELMDVLVAFEQLNDLSGFFTNALALLPKARAKEN